MGQGRGNENWGQGPAMLPYVSNQMLDLNPPRGSGWIISVGDYAVKTMQTPTCGLELPMMDYDLTSMDKRNTPCSIVCNRYVQGNCIFKI